LEQFKKIEGRIFLRPATLRQLAKWLQSAQRGKWICYWEGDLRFDRWQEEAAQKLGLGAIPDNPDSYPARKVGPWMYEQAALGRVTLWQKKLGPNNFLYLARKEVNEKP
jgi:hypothetical protein